MAELEDVTLDGKPLHSLRVADLKAALEQRGLAKSGQKNALIKRLKGALMLESLQRTSTSHPGLQPNSQIGEEMSQNSFIKQYLAKQQELLRQRMEREAREAAEADDTDSPAGPEEDDHTAVNDSTSCLPDKHHVASRSFVPEDGGGDQMGPQDPVALGSHRLDAGTASVSHDSADVPTAKIWRPSFSQEEVATPSPPRAVASLSVRVVGQPERQGVPLIVPRPQQREGTAPVEAGPAHPMPQLSQSARTQEDSDEDDDDDDDDSDEDDNWGPISRGRKNIHTPPAQRSRRKLQPPQHIPPHHSPLQLRQPTPPPSPPPELSFPLPDTPKQSPPEQDEPEAPEGAAVSSPVSLQRQESSSSSRSSSPEPRSQHRPGPLSLLVRKMESEGAFDGGQKKEEEEEGDSTAAAEEQAEAGPGVLVFSRGVTDVHTSCDSEVVPDHQDSPQVQLPEEPVALPTIPSITESSPLGSVEMKEAEGEQEESSQPDEDEKEDNLEGCSEQKEKETEESFNVSSGKREREESPSRVSSDFHHRSPSPSPPAPSKRARMFSEVPPPECLLSPSKPEQVSVLVSGPQHADVEMETEAPTASPQSSPAKKHEEEMKEVETDQQGPAEADEETEDSNKAPPSLCPSPPLEKLEAERERETSEETKRATSTEIDHERSIERERGRSAEREGEKSRERERERSVESERERSTNVSAEGEKSTDRGKEMSAEEERSTEREREISTDRQRSTERGSERSEESERFTERGRERSAERERSTVKSTVRERKRLTEKEKKSPERHSSPSSQSSSSDSDSESSSSSSSGSSPQDKPSPPSQKDKKKKASSPDDTAEQPSDAAEKEEPLRDVKQATVAEPTGPVSMELQEQPESESALAHPASQEAPETSESRSDESTTPKAFAARKISLTTAKPEGAAVDAESGGGAGRKRRWGSSTAVTAKKPSISITTESLKSLIPDLKPLQEAVVDLHPDEGRFSGDEDSGQQPERDEDQGLQIRRTVTQVVPSETQENGQKEKEEDEDEDEEQTEGEKEKPPKKQRRESSSEVAMETQEGDTKKVTPNDSVVRRSISQQKVAVSITIDDPVRTGRQLSPPRGKTSNIIHVCNLVRPFTLGQLKELLNRTGTVVEDGFWIDKIKSHCYVTYSSTEEAVATREALHGVKWPSSNPKVLRVDFCEQKELDFHKGLLTGEDPRATAASSRPTAPPPLVAPTREKERERERDGTATNVRDQWAEREREMERRERTRSEREWDRDKVRDFNRDEREVARRSRSRDRERRRKERGKSKEKKSEKKDKPEEPPAKLLDDLFRKTKAAPCIYWLPLTEEQATQKNLERAERMKEREKRRKELQEEEDKKREEERKERARGRERDGGNTASSGGGSSRPPEGEKDKERERERERERDRGREKEGEKRRDSNRGRGNDSKPVGGSRRSRSHSNPSRDRRR
ncbi:hypothetical protein Q7C36_004429 [Tachysurus vachellii]|uniref:Apoptotic chromatin condensation inducer 1 n=1 Tax=Tachysurus vachellii TaxID=175792 RepID=A0AA88NMC1_TACVA|nr:hypothetical protein Q7C36_004429 [Tachysurus vachellii]